MRTGSIIFFSQDSYKKLKDGTYEFDEERNKLIKKGIPIYKHGNGYPSNILHLLRNYLKIHPVRRTYPGYLASGFLRRAGDCPQTSKFMREDPYTRYRLYMQRITRTFLNDGWEEYFYKVTPSKIYCYSAYEKEDYKYYKQHPKLLWEEDFDTFITLPDSSPYFSSLENRILNRETQNHINISELPDEEILKIYEKYCYDNPYFESKFFPIHSMDDHFGTQVLDFILNKTSLYDEYAYYTLDGNDKVAWFTEKEAIEKAKKTLIENQNYVDEYYG